MSRPRCWLTHSSGLCAWAGLSKRPWACTSAPHTGSQVLDFPPGGS